MIDPEISYLLWKFEQSRRDEKLERRRAHLQALEPQQQGMAPEDIEDSACCELEAAS